MNRTIAILRSNWMRMACLMCLLSVCQSVYATGNITIRLGTGSTAGSYYHFGNLLAKELANQDFSGQSLKVVVVPTEGTVDNLSRLKNGTLDAAIVQNDIANYTYEGKFGYKPFSGFKAALPLFPEYVQVLVRRDSGIRMLGDLRDKVIALGPNGSGGVRNALDLLRAFGMRPDIDYVAHYAPTLKNAHELLEKQVDAMIYTGAVPPFRADIERNLLRMLPVNRDIINDLATRYPYYRSGVFKSKDILNGELVDTLTVTAFLVVSNKLPADKTSILTRAVLRNWAVLNRHTRYFRMVSLKDSLSRLPVPLSEASEHVLQSIHLMDVSYTEYYVAILACSLVVIALWARAQCNRYDRLGNVRVADGGWYYKMLILINRSRHVVYIFAGIFLVVLVFVQIIQYSEAQYAREMNIDNKFANVGFWNAVLWMFMFMGAGDSGGLFPVSPLGRILATALPFLGVSSVIGFFFAFYEQRSAEQSARKRGTLIKHVKKHVLLCGWTEKAPSIIYALTSTDAPEKKDVVVVANIDGDMPLERYRFNARYTQYCRGTSADHDVLERAEVQSAQAAIVLAGERGRADRNLGAVLSVMAMKEMHKRKNSISHLFIAAELLYEENAPLFDACGADVIVHSREIVNRIIAQCCINEGIVDFVMDMLTYDEFAEMHTMRLNDLQRGSVVKGIWTRVKHGKKQCNVNVLPKRIPDEECRSEKITANQLRKSMLSRGVNVIAIMLRSGKRDNLVGYRFDSSSKYRMFLSETDGDYLLNGDEDIIYISNEHDDVYRAPKRRCADIGIEKAKCESFVPNRSRRILLVGDSERCECIARMMRRIPWVDVNVCGVDSNSYIDLPLQYWESRGLGSADSVAIVVDVVNSGVEAVDNESEIDGRTLVAARLIRDAFVRLAPERDPTSLTLIAQLIGRNNRALFMDAGIDVVIPCDLVTERVLTRMVYTRGCVYDFMMALLAVDDDAYLCSIRIDANAHYELVGKSFDELFWLLPDGIQLMGILPIDQHLRCKLLNKKRDFTHHYIASPYYARRVKYTVQPGDILMLLGADAFLQKISKTKSGAVN